MALVAGTASFVINGASYATDGKFQIKIQGVKRNAIPSSDGGIHHSEEVVPDTVSGKLITTAALNPEVITNFANSTVQVQLKNGDVAILDEAFYSGDATVSTEDGTMDVEFTGRGRWLS